MRCMMIYKCYLVFVFSYTTLDANLLICFTSDPQVPFVPGDSTEVSQYNIPCRVTDPKSVVILRSLPSGVELPYHYEQKHGFLGYFPLGEYVCETVVNGTTVPSVVYTVKDTSSKPKFTFQLGIILFDCC